MVMGHEAVGVVEDANGTGLEEGHSSCPLSGAKPNGETNEYFRRGEPDMAPDGEYHERGIVGDHGYMSEYFTSPADALVPVPEEIAEYGIFVEPLSNTEKALEHAFAARSAFEWQPESAAVLGNGPLGLLTLWQLEQEFDRTYCLGRRDRPDLTIDFIEKVGSTYVDSGRRRSTTSRTNTSRLTSSTRRLGTRPTPSRASRRSPQRRRRAPQDPQLLGVRIDGGSLHNEIVLHNKCLVGSVNAGVRHFEGSVDTVASMPDDLLDHLITTVTDPENVEPAFEDGDDQIKAVVEFEELGSPSVNRMRPYRGAHRWENQGNRAVNTGKS